MSVWDFVILVLLVAGAYRGFQKGLLMSVVSLVALVAGVVCALAWTPALLQYLSGRSQMSPELLSVLAFLIIFIGVIILINIVGKLIKIVIDLTPIGSIDGLVGALLGMLKWALGVSIILWVLDKVDVGLPTDQDSAILSNVRQVAPYIFEQVKLWSPYFSDLLDDLNKVITAIRREQPT